MRKNRSDLLSKESYATAEVLSGREALSDGPPPDWRDDAGYAVAVARPGASVWRVFGAMPTSAFRAVVLDRLTPGDITGDRVAARKPLEIRLILGAGACLLHGPQVRK